MGKVMKITYTDIKLAFSEWLFEYKLCDSEAWAKLTVDERNILTKYHFNRFLKELKSYVKQSSQNS